MATRTINVLQVCDAPEFVCVADNTLCSTAGFCIGDPVGEEDNTPEDTAPVLLLNTVVDVIGAEVRVRRYKTYAPCQLDSETGLNIVPTAGGWMRTNTRPTFNLLLLLLLLFPLLPLLLLLLLLLSRASVCAFAVKVSCAPTSVRMLVLNDPIAR